MKFEKHNKMVEKRGFYIALCVCLIALTALCWNVADNNDEDTQITPESNVSSSITENVAEVVSGVPYDNASSKAEKEKEEIVSNTASSNIVENSESSMEQTPFFILPVGGEISKSFNAKTPQYSETYKDWRLHLGVDIKGSVGTAVMSSGFGKVSKIYKDTMWGNVVEISHGGGIVGIYCGINGKPTVKEGDEVEAGQQIGTIDTIPCEGVEAPHLHFAMKKNDEWVDPIEYIG